MLTGGCCCTSSITGRSLAALAGCASLQCLLTAQWYCQRSEALIAGPSDVCWPRGSLALMPPPLAPPGSPICSSPCIHYSRGGSDPFWMSLVASVASQDLHSRHLHSVCAALGLPHRHKVSALTPNWFRPLRWVVRTAVAGPAADVTSAAGTLFYRTQGNPEPGQKDPTHQDAAYAHQTPIAANG